MQTDQLTTQDLADRYGAAWGENDVDAIMALQGEDMVFQLHAAGFEPAIGPEAVRAQFAYFFEAWDPMRFETRSMRVAEGVFVNEFRFMATLVKPFPLLGEVIEPSGRSVDVHGVDVITERDGLVRSKHTYMDTLTLRRQLDARAAFVEQFAAGWQSGSLEAFLDAFAPVIDPDVRLIHPPLPTTRGWDGFVGFATSVFELLPDVRGQLVGWTPTTNGVAIDLDLVGTLAGKPLRLRTHDVIELRDGRVLSRRAHLAHGTLVRAAMRPSVLPRLARAAFALRRART
jgi:ketosteroid isomerase-like protein